METLEFLEAVLSDNGQYCLFAVKDKQKIRQQFYPDIPTLIANGLAANEKGWDVWFAMGTFTETPSRKADNVLEVKSFFLDVDCGEGKPYLTQKEGAIAVTAFCQRAGLPAPIQVNSGYGIHCYWILPKPIPYAQWFPIAEGLKQLTVQLKFHVDPAVTSDAARVLRLPGTLNYKYGTQKQCRIVSKTLPAPIDLSVMEEAVAAAPILAPTKNSLVAKLYRDEQAKLHANKVYKFKNLVDKTVVGKGCPQLAYIIKNRTTLEEPLWRAGLSLIKVASDEEKPKAINLISKGYPGFSMAEAYKKMNDTANPYTCGMIGALNPGVCETCPIKDRKFMSPVALGMEIAHATAADNVVPIDPKPAQKMSVALEGTLEPKPTFQNTMVNIPSYPAPYFRGKNGGVYIRIREVGKDGAVEVTEAQVYQYDLYAVQRVKDPEDGECIVLQSHKPNDPMASFTIPMKELARQDGIHSTLLHHGVVVPSSNKKGITDYVMHWIQHLQATTTLQDAATQFGWDSQNSAFNVGEHRVLEGGKIVTNHPSSRTRDYFKYFKSRGTLEGWRKAISFFDKPGMEAHQFAIGTAFGSPLIEFIPNVQAGAMHMYSGDTGTGKTTAIWAAASVWGDYRVFCGKAGDTSNHILNRAEVWKNLPLYVDELTNAEPKSLSDYVLSISQGQQRGRLEGSANKERFRGDPWALLAVSTGNTSISEKISTVLGDPRAELARILEVHINDFTTMNGAILNTKEFNLLMENNFGHAGLLYMAAIQREKDFIIDEVRRLVDIVESRFNLTIKDRFWSAYIAATIYGLTLTKKLGLHNFDMDAIWKFAEKLVQKNKDILTDVHQTSEDVINEYISTHYNDMLVISGGVDNRSGVNIMPDKKPTGSLLIRYEPDTDTMFIVTKNFRDWCVLERRLNFNEILTDMMKRYEATNKATRPAKGTDMANLVIRCLKFKTNGFVKVPNADSPTP